MSNPREVKEEVTKFNYDVPYTGPPIRFENACDWWCSYSGQQGYQHFDMRTSFTFGMIGDRICVIDVMRY